MARICLLPAKRKLARLGGLAALVVVVLGACSDSGSGSGSDNGLPRFDDGKRPNVLIVLADVLRRDHLGVYGYALPTSPYIDAFAAEGFRFEQMYSHSTWTKPSVATLFTSVYPDQHGLGRVGFEDDAGFHTDVLPENLETLAEVFQAAGYRTGSVGANVHIQQKTGFGQGFDGFWMKRLVWGRALNAQLQKWLDGAPRESHEPGAEQPFFAYLHYMDAHWPYEQWVRGDTRVFGPLEYQRPPPETWTAVPGWAREHLDSEALAVLTAHYDREISYVDTAFGEMLANLEERGILDDTIVIFVADHGEGLYEHERLQHSFAPYPEVTGVPLIVRLPPIYDVAPGTSSAIVGLVDVMPTVLELVGLEVPAQTQGRSLTPLMLGQRLRERPVYMDGEGVRAMRSSRFTVFLDQEGQSTCFERATDPMEVAPLDEPTAACTRMASALASLVRSFESQAGSVASGATVELDADEIEELRALGYLD